MSRRPPATLQVTFDGLQREQLQPRWIDQVGGMEAYVFDGRELADEKAWALLRSNLQHAQGLGAEPLTAHFPTDNADWVNEDALFRTLLRFCDVAAEGGAEGVVLHANQFVDLEDWPRYDLPAARARVVDKLAELDDHLDGSPLWIGVENMPMIGSAGIDFDSVFVRPADFDGLAALRSPRIGVTWDVCHWAVTYSMLRAVAHLDQEEPPVHPLDLPIAPVRHIHFGSFTGHAMPYWTSDCFEGSPPQDGDFDQDLLAAMLAGAIRASVPGTSVVLEVQEQDYQDRQACWDTRAWIETMPVLAGLVSTGKPA